MARFSRQTYFLMMMLAAGGTGIAQNRQSTGGPEPLSLTISATQDTVVAGSPVTVKTVVRNTSSQDISMWFTIGDMFRADVRDAKGEVPAETTYGFYHDRRIDVGRVLGNNDVDLRSLNGSRLHVTYKANQSLTGSADISTMYNLDEPGTYTIVLSLTDLPGVKSNSVTVTVVPAPAAASAQAAEQGSSSAPLSLDIKTDPLARSGQPVDVLVVTKNISAHRIVLRRQVHEQDTGVLGSLFRVDVSDSQGNSPVDTQLGQSTNHSADAPPDPAIMEAARAAGTLVSLGPNENWRNTMRVSDLYDLSKPGQYTIQVRRWDDDTKTWVKSNTVTVTITQ